MKNIQVAMGEVPTVLRRKVVADGEVVSLEQIEVHERNGQAANQGLALLIKELDTIDPPKPRVSKGVEAEKSAGRLEFEASMKRYAEVRAEMTAKAAAGQTATATPSRTEGQRERQCPLSPKAGFEIAGYLADERVLRMVITR